MTVIATEQVCGPERDETRALLPRSSHPVSPHFRSLPDPFSLFSKCSSASPNPDPSSFAQSPVPAPSPPQRAAVGPRRSLGLASPLSPPLL
ncbi:hypothetical protein Q5P01_001453 [Channa striata]|uniref:Uncharacterized protein n=1 Tax=Channa striata TaxID=64152 RepID=A0AA88TCI2_CHASR|nr:hypothetical protein Q5P01_001453 [Channa striata]